MDRLSDRDGDPPGGREAQLDSSSESVAAADPAAEVKRVEAVIAPPAREAVEGKVARARPARGVGGAAQVVVQPRRLPHPEHGREQLAVPADVDAHEPHAVAQRVPVARGKQ